MRMRELVARSVPLRRSRGLFSSLPSNLAPNEHPVTKNLAKYSSEWSGRVGGRGSG